MLKVFLAPFPHWVLLQRIFTDSQPWRTDKATPTETRSKQKSARFCYIVAQWACLEPRLLCTRSRSHLLRCVAGLSKEKSTANIRADPERSKHGLWVSSNGIFTSGEARWSISVLRSPPYSSANEPEYPNNRTIIGYLNIEHIQLCVTHMTHHDSLLLI